MAYSEELADRVRKVMKGKRGLSEKKMFGGLSFLMRGRMCCGVLGEKLVIRVSTEEYDNVLEHRHVAPMDFTGRALKGLVYVLPGGTKTDAMLKKWVGRSVAFARKPQTK
ncbi:MAG TPA: TfoX/Sxy family protein [Nitrospiria bacterium]|nr:TfoX/Sxy family protein [Nitrospiria bacterium]